MPLVVSDSSGRGLERGQPPRPRRRPCGARAARRRSAGCCRRPRPTNTSASRTISSSSSRSLAASASPAPRPACSRCSAASTGRSARCAGRSRRGRRRRAAPVGRAVLRSWRPRYRRDAATTSHCASISAAADAEPDCGLRSADGWRRSSPSRPSTAAVIWMTARSAAPGSRCRRRCRSRRGGCRSALPFELQNTRSPGRRLRRGSGGTSPPASTASPRSGRACMYGAQAYSARPEQSKPRTWQSLYAPSPAQTP